MGHTLVVSAVFVVIVAVGRGQLQYFYPFGASLPDRQEQQQQQQQYQSADAPVLLTNPASFNYLQSSAQEAAHHVPASIVNQKYVLRIKVKPTGGRQLNYEKYFVPSNVPLVLPQAHPSSSFAVSPVPAHSASAPVLSHQQLTSSAPDSAAHARHAALGTDRTAPAAGLLGVAFSPAADVSQFRFSGSFANYSY